MRRIVAVLGGNAFAPSEGSMTMEGQIAFAHHATEQLTPLFNEGTQLLLSHGNGPQVGHILRRVEAAIGQSYRLPLDVCVTESEGELGFELGQAFRNISHQYGAPRDVVSVLTQVEVGDDDPAFAQQSKPIGPFLSSTKPVIAITAVRTGVGKSPTSQMIAKRLSDHGRRVGVIRHPMP